MQTQLAKISYSNPVARIDPLNQSELITRFILSRDVRPSSKGLYIRTLKQYFNWIHSNDLDLSQITSEDILKYKQNLIDSGLSSLTVGSYVTVVRLFYQFCEVNRIYPNIARNVKNPRRENAFRKSVLNNQESEMLITFYQDKPREYAIINLLLRTGLRTIEVIRANIEDIRIKGGQKVLMVQGKGWDDRTQFVCLSDKCIKAINDYLATRGRTRGGDPLFVSHSNNNQGQRLTTFSISQIAKKGLRAIGLNDHTYTAHSLRHTCAVSILRAGGTIQDAQHVLRHASPVTTQLYISSINEEQRLKAPAEYLLDSQF